MAEQITDEALVKLNTLYTEADSADKNLFSEMRSNCQLYIGYHYAKTNSPYERLKSSNNIPQEKKIRLTKNHIGAICDRLMNATVTGHAPSVVIQPRHKMELADKKAADIATGVWNRIRKANRFDEQIADLAFDFIVTGEMAALIHFDPAKGEYLGMAPVVDEFGNEIDKPRPKFSGEVVIEKLDPFNTLRCASAKSWETSPYIITRKMVPIENLKPLIGDDEEKLKKLTASRDESFVVFDVQKAQYGQSAKDQALVLQLFYRPCQEYPEGHYFLFTRDLLITDGSLNGIFPIVYRPYSKVTTSPRGYGIIKRLRPLQAECNRISSSMAQSQLYFRDRLLVQNGSKITNGGTMGGATVMRYSGAAPMVQKGESGDHYLTVLEQAISEMYSLANLQQEEEEKVPNTDPMALLFRSMKDKKKFSQKSDIFESAIKDIVEISLQIAQLHYTDEHLTPSVDKKDYINIQEFKNITKMDYSLEVKSSSSDVESVLGQQLSIQHALQYGQNLPPEQLATLVANMPYLKDSHIAQEITADLRAAEDVFASIERGQPLPVMQMDNHDYFIKRIGNRMKESSFRFLDPQIQQLYQERLAEHERISVENADKLARAQQGLIPTTGALIPVSIYTDPNNSSKRMRMPHDALLWLSKKLEDQGMLQAGMEDMGPEISADMLQYMNLPQQDETHMTSSLQPEAGVEYGY